VDTCYSIHDGNYGFWVGGNVVIQGVFMTEVVLSNREKFIWIRQVKCYESCHPGQLFPR